MTFLAAMLFSNQVLSSSAPFVPHHSTTDIHMQEDSHHQHSTVPNAPSSNHSTTETEGVKDPKKTHEDKNY